MLDPEDLWKCLHAVAGMDADFGIPIDLQRHFSLQNAIVVRFSSTFGIIAIPRSIPESLCNDRLIRAGANSPGGIPAGGSGSQPA
jgi:hypothetical protein